MKPPKLIWLLVALIFHAQALAQVDNSSRWLDRPWEIRYLLFISGQHMFESSRRIARAMNNTMTLDGVEKYALTGQGLFGRGSHIAVPHAESVITVLIQFDGSGHARSKDLAAGTWLGKRDKMGSILLLDAGDPRKKPYYLAEWSQGIAGQTEFSPAVCAEADSSRYLDDWDRNSIFGSFGCREWTAQLYRWSQPYIDVTSYSEDGPFIGEMIGWSRLSDEPKPVIGLQGKTWLCLHECPDGEKPGPIKNIRAWTYKHGFPVPERPPGQPLYPNSNYRDSVDE